ncbi:unnamed protein product [Amoebophrya sp. A25]|nr:unnamed protein product [Amoebophrya sp. A25]|eukprot:GSA25T00010136001.1
MDTRGSFGRGSSRGLFAPSPFGNDDWMREGNHQAYHEGSVEVDDYGQGSSPLVIPDERPAGQEAEVIALGGDSPGGFRTDLEQDQAHGQHPEDGGSGILSSVSKPIPRLKPVQLPGLGLGNNGGLITSNNAGLTTPAFPSAGSSQGQRPGMFTFGGGMTQPKGLQFPSLGGRSQQGSKAAQEHQAQQEEGETTGQGPPADPSSHQQQQQPPNRGGFQSLFGGAPAMQFPPLFGGQPRGPQLPQPQLLGGLGLGPGPASGPFGGAGGRQQEQQGENNLQGAEVGVGTGDGAPQASTCPGSSSSRQMNLIARVIISDDFEPDLALEDSSEQEEGEDIIPQCVLSCPESSVDVDLLDAQTGDLVQNTISLPLRFLNLHLNNCEYENGTRREVNEKALIKCPLGRYSRSDLPALRIQLCGSSGKVGFVDRGPTQEEEAPKPNSLLKMPQLVPVKPPKKGEGIFHYSLQFEADAVAEGVPGSEDRELFLDVKCLLSGTIQVSKVVG